MRAWINGDLLSDGEALIQKIVPLGPVGE